MNKLMVLILISLCMAGCTQAPARPASPSGGTLAAGETDAIDLGEDITDSVMGTEERFQTYTVGSWVSSDGKQRLTVDEDTFVLYADGALGQESETPPGDLPVNMMYGADQEGNPMRLTVGTCYENAMTATIGQSGEIVFLRDGAEQ